jgi:hypothetical protein
MQGRKKTYEGEERVMIELKIPISFQQPPFFVGSETVAYDENVSFQQAVKASYFLYELAALEELETYKPWNDKEHAISILINSWKEEKDHISSLFRERKRKDAKEPMVRFSAHFLSLLYWMNSKVITSLIDIEKQLAVLDVKPVNVSERLEFILAQPDHYHSFIQLAQLYEEGEKLFVKSMLMQKKPSRE